MVFAGVIGICMPQQATVWCCLPQMVEREDGWVRSRLYEACLLAMILQV
jgi:hypothetical protein